MKAKLLSVLTLSLIFFSSAFAGDKFDVNGISYEIFSTNTVNGELIEGKVRVVAGAVKYSGDIIIPEKVIYNDFEYLVEEVGSSAFSNCSNLKSVVLPNSILILRNNAFWACDNLSNIELSESLTTIGSNCFYMTTKLGNITLPNSLKKIDNGAFESSALTKIGIPQNVDEINGNPFSGCAKLESIEVDTRNAVFDSRNGCNAVIKDNILIIGCKNSTVPEGIIAIGDNAFKNCDGLTSIKMSNSVITIGKAAFWACDNLSNIELSESLTTIGSNCFYMTTKLGNITLPNTLKKIDNGAFESSALTKIGIPQNVDEINGNPFSGCAKLESIEVDTRNAVFDSRNGCNAVIKDNVLIIGCKNSTVPEGIIAIGDNAFKNCDGLTSIKMSNSIITIGKAAFWACDNLSNIELSESLTTIGSNCFYLAKKLETITLPKSLQKIDNSAFEDCGLKSIMSEIYTPFPIDKSVFGGYSTNIYNDAILYVKEGRIPIYQETEGWKDFKNIKELEADINFADGTFSYTLSPLRKTGTIIALNGNANDVTIPELVTCRGDEYAINKIKDGVFSKKDVVTVRFPETKQTLGTGMFEGSYKLSAIIWNRSDRPSEELIRSIESPNVLFFVKSEDAAPTNLTNVIVNNVAKNIVLVDAPETNFYCPQEFTAENISYTHTYSLKTERGVVMGWESIALPFDVQKYETTDGEAKPYAVATSGEKLFWLRELTDAGFKEATGIKANVPYIISMPNWDGYQDFYNIEGDVTFSAQNAIVPKTEVENVVYGTRTFSPCFSTIKSQAEIFVLNKVRMEFSNTGNIYLPGSTFIANIRKANPFECYFTYSGASQARALSLSDMMGDDTTDISPILYNDEMKFEGSNVYFNSSTNESLNIHTLSGQSVKTVKLNKGQNIISGLTKGIYIIKGRKIAIQ